MHFSVLCYHVFHKLLFEHLFNEHQWCCDFTATPVLPAIALSNVLHFYLNAYLLNIKKVKRKKNACFWYVVMVYFVSKWPGQYS